MCLDVDFVLELDIWEPKYMLEYCLVYECVILEPRHIQEKMNSMNHYYEKIM
jgi:hypothetical protein